MLSLHISPAYEETQSVKRSQAGPFWLTGVGSHVSLSCLPSAAPPPNTGPKNSPVGLQGCCKQSLKPLLSPAPFIAQVRELRPRERANGPGSLRRRDRTRTLPAASLTRRLLPLGPSRVSRLPGRSCAAARTPRSAPPSPSPDNPLMN